MAKKILVTGGTGYIGSHTSVELINAGYEVVIVDNLANSDQSSLDGIQKITGTRPAFEQFDLCDKEKTDRLFDKYENLVAVIHFAAHKAVGESVQKPLLYYRNNLVSTLNILEAMARRGVKHLVFSSSCTVYGQPAKLPVTEDSPVVKAESPYGNTKQINEEMISEFVGSGAPIDCIALRYFNPIGAHESAHIGELPRGVPNCLVPFLTQTAAGVRSELSVFGNDYNTPDGSCIRDYINVVDLAQAHLFALRRMENAKQKKPYEFFNVGTGRGTSVLELIQTFERVTGVPVKHKIVGRRSGDIEKVWADTTIANRELGWKANKSLDETLVSAWKWEKKIRGL